MAKRYISDEILYSDAVMHLSPIEYVVFTRLWTKCDDWGTLVLSRSVLEGLFPRDYPVTMGQIEEAFRGLVEKRVVVVGEVEGVRFMANVFWFDCHTIPRYSEPLEHKKGVTLSALMKLTIDVQADGDRFFQVKRFVRSFREHMVKKNGRLCVDGSSSVDAVPSKRGGKTPSESAATPDDENIMHAHVNISKHMHAYAPPNPNLNDHDSERVSIICESQNTAVASPARPPQGEGKGPDSAPRTKVRGRSDGIYGNAAFLLGKDSLSPKEVEALDSVSLDDRFDASVLYSAYTAVKARKGTRHDDLVYLANGPIQDVIEGKIGSRDIPDEIVAALEARIARQHRKSA